MQMRYMISLVILEIVLMLGCPFSMAGEPGRTGDWPLARGNLLQNNRAIIRGHIAGAPALAWRHAVGKLPAVALTADLDEDDRSESYAVENWCIVRRDEQNRVVWKSEPIARSFSLVGFEDL